MGALIGFIKGLVIGIGAILPGLSGGVMAVVFGVYEPALAFIADIRKDFWKNVRFFIPIAIGGVGGVLLFSFVVKKALEGRWEAISICLFIGFVIGTFPALFKKAGEQGRSTKDWLALVLVAALFYVLMTFGAQKELIKIAPSLPVWFASGFLIGLGFVVPGLSPSNFLIYFGLYQPMSARLAALDIPVALMLFLGVVASALCFSKLMTKALDKQYSLIYHAILGLVVGSSIVIFPTKVMPAFAADKLAEYGWSFGLLLLLCVIALLVGAVASYAFSRFEQKYEH